MGRLICLVLAFTVISSQVQVSSQQSTMGTDFIVALGPIQAGNGQRAVKIAASETSNVTLTFNNIAANTPNVEGVSRVMTATIFGGTIKTFNLPDRTAQEAAIMATNANPVIGTYSLSIHSDKDISVYIVNSTNNYGDATVVLPVSALDTEYYYMSWQNGNRNNAYVVVATENGTTVQLNGTIQRTLNAGQSYYYEFNGDNTGWRITANKPIAFFVSNQSTSGLGSNSNMLFEQLMPTSRLGTFFLAPILNASQRIRVVTTVPGTTISYQHSSNASPTITPPYATAGSVLTLPVSGSIAANTSYWIQSSHPVAVTSYLSLPISAGTLPAMSQVPAVQQATTSIIMAPFNGANANTHGAILVTPWISKDSTKMTIGTGSTTALTGGTWYQGAGNGSYAYYHLPSITDNTYIFSNKAGVIVWVYGYGSNNSYYYVGGAATRELKNEFFLDDIGELYGEHHCFDMKINVRADLMLPLNSKDGRLKWYHIMGTDTVELTHIQDSLEWTMEYFINGTHTIRLEATDAFDLVHVLEAKFTQDCPATVAVMDTVSILSCKPATIDVLANDTFGMCSAGTITALVSKPPASGGTAVFNTGNKFVYTPPPNFLGRDSLEYGLVCADTTVYAKVYILVMECPDNIVEAECTGQPPPQAWSIQELVSTGANFSPYQSAMVGDVDGCGIPEIIVCMDPLDVTVGGINRPSSSIAVFKGNNITTPWKIITTVAPYSWDHITKYGIVKTKIDDKDTVLIVVAESDRYLRAYSYNNDRVWTSSTVYHSTASQVGYNSKAPGFADFNHDGIPEIMVAGKIFNSVNGQFLCGTPVDPPFQSCVSIAADLFNTGTMNFIVGNSIYTPNASLNALSLEQTLTLPINPADPAIPPALGVRPAFTGAGGLSSNDGGLVSAVDMDNDGKLDLIYQVNRSGLASPYFGEALIAVVDPSTGAIKASKYIPYAPMCSWPFVGDIDGCGSPEIVFISSRANTAPPNATEQPYWLMHAYKYQAGNPLLQKFWEYQHQDPSGLTGMTLFDFNQDGISEIVYRDEQNIRIINGSLINHSTGLPVTAPYNLVMLPNTSGTSSEYPVVADIDGDGHAEIVIVGGTAARTTLGSLRVYKSGNISTSPWAPARTVWNQHAYNAPYVNEDLSLPRFPVNPATVFPGHDGLFGTSDDVRPFNNFLQQQTLLSTKGEPLWRLPDVVVNSILTHATISGNAVTITVGITNQGDAPIGPPVSVTLYKESSPQSFASAYKIATGSLSKTIAPGETEVLVIQIPDIRVFFPMANLVIRLNDDGISTFPYHQECKDNNNIMTIPNPGLHLMMKKDATLLITPPFSSNGTRANPVAVLGNERIEYTITAVNASVRTVNMVIRDTLPAYLIFEDNYPVVSLISIPGTPSRLAFEWTYANVPPLATINPLITIKAYPEPGSSASQPLYDNRAWVFLVRGVGDTIKVPTNYTWHQGAGVSEVTFSAGFGGSIFQAIEQVLDYRSSPRPGIVIVPNEGYHFTGWSHPDYLSLRGETIKAQSGIMRYDTLTVYGNVNLQADFSLDEYAIRYLLNGGENALNNPSTYTIVSGAIILNAPSKKDDVFIGWTGSNGDEPQLSVTISGGSTGDRVYFANYLYSGREEIVIPPTFVPTDDLIWTAKDELFVRTSKPGSILRIYSTSGILLKQQVIVQPGETKLKLPAGLYVVTLNNGNGKIVVSK